MFQLSTGLLAGQLIKDSCAGHWDKGWNRTQDRPATARPLQRILYVTQLYVLCFKDVQKPSRSVLAMFLSPGSNLLKKHNILDTQSTCTHRFTFMITAS